MVEAAEGVSANELANGLQTVVTLPAGASVGDVLTLLFKDPNGDERTVTHSLTALDLAAGQVTMLAPPSVVDSTENGLYTLTSSIARASDGLSNTGSAISFVLDTQLPDLFVTVISGDAVALPKPAVQPSAACSPQ
jgi:hypothetical protein